MVLGLGRALRPPYRGMLVLLSLPPRRSYVSTHPPATWATPPHAQAGMLPTVPEVLKYLIRAWKAKLLSQRFCSFPLALSSLVSFLGKLRSSMLGLAQ
jgi:hypothetical protein